MKLDINVLRTLDEKTIAAVLTLIPFAIEGAHANGGDKNETFSALVGLQQYLEFCSAVNAFPVRIPGRHLDIYLALLSSVDPALNTPIKMMYEMGMIDTSDAPEQETKH